MPWPGNTYAVRGGRIRARTTQTSRSRPPAPTVLARPSNTTAPSCHEHVPMRRCNRAATGTGARNSTSTAEIVRPGAASRSARSTRDAVHIPCTIGAPKPARRASAGDVWIGFPSVLASANARRHAGARTARQPTFSTSPSAVSSSPPSARRNARAGSDAVGAWPSWVNVPTSLPSWRSSPFTTQSPPRIRTSNRQSSRLPTRSSAASQRTLGCDSTNATAPSSASATLRSNSSSA